MKESAYHGYCFYMVPTDCVEWSIKILFNCYKHLKNEFLKQNKTNKHTHIFWLLAAVNNNHRGSLHIYHLTMATMAYL
jgi:hypothetical protein